MTRWKCQTAVQQGLDSCVLMLRIFTSCIYRGTLYLKLGNYPLDISIGTGTSMAGHEEPVLIHNIDWQFSDGFILIKSLLHYILYINPTLNF